MPKNGGTGKERTRFFPVSFSFPFFYLSFPGTSLALGLDCMGTGLVEESSVAV